MTSKMKKIIAAMMAASIIACVGAGCANNDNKDKAQESSAASVATSGEESKDESEIESSVDSKAESSEESKTESSEDSSAVSIEENSATSVEESKTESAEGSTTVSDEESAEGSAIDYSGYAAFFGSWEYEVGNQYHAFEINSDGTAAYRTTDGSSLPARWSVENGKLCLRAAGGLETFDYVDGKLIDSDTGIEYLKVDTLSVDANSEVSDLSGYAAFFGSWEYEVGNQYHAFEINSDGTAAYRTTDGSSLPARWSVEDGKLCIRAAGGLETFDYVDGTLKDTQTGLIYLKVETLSVDR